MELATQIRILRESKNISREQMADWLSIALNTYKKIEYNEGEPSYSEITKICEKLEVHPGSLFQTSGNTYIQNGQDYSGVFGNGNTIHNDKEIFLTLNETLKEIPKAIISLAEVINSKK